MERIGQPSTIHMEIIEEDVEKEGFGTDFKRGRQRGGAMWADKCDDSLAHDQKSNKSSPVRQNVATADDDKDIKRAEKPFGERIERI